MIQDVLLSPIVIFLSFGVLLIVVSRWAFAGDTRDRLSYALGWMVGFLFILVHQAVTPAEVPDAEEVVEAVTLGELIFPAFFGLFLGTAGIVLLGLLTSQSKIQKRAIIVLLTAVLIFVMYLVAVGSQHTAQVLGVGVLCFGIGVMTVYIFAPVPQAGSRGSIERTRDRYEEPEPYRPDGDIPSADPDRARDRFDEIRRKYK